MIVKLYKSYGVLAHEKEPFYSYTAPASEIYDMVSVEIPETFKPREAAYDNICVTIGKYPRLLNEALTNVGDAPALGWWDGEKDVYRILRIV